MRPAIVSKVNGAVKRTVILFVLNFFWLDKCWNSIITPWFTSLYTDFYYIWPEIFLFSVTLFEVKSLTFLPVSLTIFLGKYGIIPKGEVNYGIQIIWKFNALHFILKELGITHIVEGAIKSFLSEHSVYFNGELESRRGKKLRVVIKLTAWHEYWHLVDTTVWWAEEYQADKLKKNSTSNLLRRWIRGVKKMKSKPTSITQKQAKSSW